MSKSTFTGVIAGVTYADRDAFEKAARDCGYRLGKGRTGDWRVGTPVRIRLGDDGAYVEGQVWAKGDLKGSVWVALDDGRYARVWTGHGSATILAGRGQDEEIGRVAA